MSWVIHIIVVVISFVMAGGIAVTSARAETPDSVPGTYQTVLDNDGEFMLSRLETRTALESQPELEDQLLSLVDSLSAHIHDGRPQVITDFRDGSHRVEIPPAPILDYRDGFSFSLWLHLEADHMVAQTKIVSHAGVQTGKVTVMGQGRRIFVMLRYDNGAELIFRAVPEIDVRRWVHLVITFDRSGGPAIFIDGKKSRLRIRSGKILHRPLLSLPDQPLYLGGLDRSFPGRIDDLRLYERSLSAGEIEILAKGGDLSEGLIGHWPLDESNDLVTPDATGNGNSGIVGNDVATGLEGHIGKSMGFERHAADWIERLHDLERRLDETVAGHGGPAKTDHSSLPELRKTLEANDAVLIHFEEDGDDLEELALWVIDPRQDQPAIRLSLALSSSWRRALDLFHDELKQGYGSPEAEELVKQAARTVALELWDPIENIIGENREVWLRLNPSLRGIPFSALVGPDGRYLVERFAFARSGPVPALAARQQPPTEISHRMVALANPDFHAIGDGKSGRLPMSSTVREQYRGDPNRPCRIEGPVLMGSSREIEAVTPLVRAGGFQTLEVYEWAEAQENQLDRVAAGAGIIHIATHGYQVDLRCLPAAPADPLYLSGVVLAGALRDLPDEYRGANEGLLASSEVAELDLSSAQLLVWSGCATATGYSLPGEPMCGLAAAGWLAGARANVATLWRVSDETMPVQIEAFYRAWLQESGSARALQAALKAGLAASRKDRGHGHPSRWASLVVEGL